MGALWVHVNVKITAFRHRRIPVRSPVKRLIEVLLLVLITNSAWFVITYASTCDKSPSKVCPLKPDTTTSPVAVGLRHQAAAYKAEWDIGLC